MSERNRLAELLYQRPATHPYGDSLLARLAMAPPLAAIDALPTAPAREAATMPTPQRQTSESFRAMALAELLDPSSSFNRISAGFLGPATIGRAPTRYVRRSQNTSSPMNDRSNGMAMFVETRDPRGTLDQLSGYGPAAWITRGDGATDVRTLQPAMVRALREAGAHEEYGTTAARLAREANPPNIVDSAGLWDNQRLVQEMWDRVLEPRGITSVRTNDGLLIFDPALARPIRAP